ncbi:hypothetical protein [Sneathia sanguinegens]|uniref:hypothetical protein n=1 Tax=Sneathia sanguinegens TaxID=40543 RepID=UPI00288B37F3|nr:hypothetical protein [Sneathia sanguinegens]
MKQIQNLTINEKIKLVQQGRDQDLNILVNDKSEYVREAVATQGRDQDLDILVNDKDIFVLGTLILYRRAKDIEILKARIKNGEFNNIQSELEKRIFNDIKNKIQGYENI